VHHDHADIRAAGGQMGAQALMAFSVFYLFWHRPVGRFQPWPSAMAILSDTDTKIKKRQGIIKETVC
jgi:hypothetical protein